MALDLQPTIIIRSVGSVEVGTGHLRRMGILSLSLMETGYRTLLYCNSEAKSVYPKISYEFSDITTADSEMDFIKYIEIENSKCTIAAIIFDDYSLNEDTHYRYRKFAFLLAGLDDLANRKLGFDLLFDMNFNRSKIDYFGLINVHTKAYFGQNFQIVNKRFYELSKSGMRRFRSPLKRFFISFGGTDPKCFTMQSLMLAQAVFPKANFDVVVGAHSKRLKKLRKYVTEHSDKVTLHVNSDQVPELMHSSDFAIGAGGTMTWERNIIGLPSIILLLAENQNQVGAAMNEKNAAIVLDAKATFPKKGYLKALEKVSNDPEYMHLLSKNARKLAGTNGAANIANIIHENIKNSNGV